jgi:hypothetical protein
MPCTFVVRPFASANACRIFVTMNASGCVAAAKRGFTRRTGSAVATNQPFKAPMDVPHTTSTPGIGSPSATPAATRNPSTTPAS